VARPLAGEVRLQGPLPTGFLMPGELDIGPVAEEVIERRPLVTLRTAA